MEGLPVVTPRNPQSAACTKAHLKETPTPWSDQENKVPHVRRLTWCVFNFLYYIRSSFFFFRFFIRRGAPPPHFLLALWRKPPELLGPIPDRSIRTLLPLPDSKFTLHTQICPRLSHFPPSLLLSPVRTPFLSPCPRPVWGSVSLGSLPPPGGGESLPRIWVMSWKVGSRACPSGTRSKETQGRKALEEDPWQQCEIQAGGEAAGRAQRTDTIPRSPAAPRRKLSS